MNLQEKLWKTFISQISLPENKILLQKSITQIVKFITVVLMSGTTVFSILGCNTTGPRSAFEFEQGLLTFYPFAVDKINTKYPWENKSY